MDNDFILRMIEPADLPVVAGWAECHGGHLNAALLPRLGMLAIDVDGPCAALWLRMDNSVGVATLDCPVARPGLGVAMARRAFAALVRFMECEALRMDYGFIMTFAEPGVARIMKGFGYQVAPVKLQMITKSLQ